MSTIIIDERIIRERITARAGRRLENELKFLHGLKTAIAECRDASDVSFRRAIAHWIATLADRLPNRTVEQRILLPHLLREALRLVSQTVILTPDGRLYSAAGRQRLQLLYTPHVS